MVQDARGPATAPPSPPAIFDMVYGLFRAQLVYVAARLGIADLLADGPKPVEDLAAATGTYAPSLRRVLRALAGEGLFAQDEQGRFVLTPPAELLRTTGVPTSLRPMAMFYGSPAIWSAWGSLLESVRTGETAFDAVHGASFFDYIGQHPDEAVVFNQFMTALPLHLAAAAYDYTGASLVVDVGGGHGSSLIAILQANPHLRGLLFDLPGVAEGARAPLGQAGLSGRCEADSGDFFQSVPPGGDVYLLSNILHDWDDERAAQILRNCRRSMPDHGKLVVVEAVVPEGNEPHPAKLIDIQMLVVLGGLQRTQGEFRALLAGADFELTRVMPVGPVTGIIEAVPV